MKQLETKLFFYTIVIMIPIMKFYENDLTGHYLNQILLFSLPLLWPGLAHGSLDISIAKHKRIIKNKLETVFFLIAYITIPLIFFIMWINFPNFVFLLFLFLSALHFGISDSITKNNLIEIFIRGMIVITLPFKFHLERSIEIFSFFFVETNFLSSISLYFNYIYFLVVMLIIVWFAKNLNSISKSQEQRILAIEIFLLFFCFWFFEPLFSFFIYFCFLHSTRHLIEEKNNLQLKASKLILKTIPMTLLTLLFFTLIFFLFYDSVNTLALSYVVIGLSSLTISHIVLINFTKNN